MQLEILTLCRDARYNGQFLDITGAFDVFASNVAPVVVPECAIAGRVRFERIEEGKHEVKVLVIDADGHPLMPEIIDEIEIEFSIDLPTVYKAFVIHLHELRLPEFGEYAIKLAIDKVLIGSVPIYLVQREPSTKV